MGYFSRIARVLSQATEVVLDALTPARPRRRCDRADARAYRPERWLYAIDPNQLFEYDESAGPQVNGLFGLAGGGLAIDGPNGQYESTSRAETDGPNCSDYQRYLRGQGYDVKQGPNPNGDMFWIEDGSPFF